MTSRWLVAAAAVALGLVAATSWRDRGRLEARAIATERQLDELLAEQRQLAAALDRGLAGRTAGGASAVACAPASPSPTSAALAPAVAGTRPMTLDEAEEEPLTAEELERRAHAWSAVDEVLARGVWTEDDRAQHGPLFRSVDDAERFRILTALAAAMNRGELAPTHIDFM